MANKKSQYGSVRRFGPRYGRTLKNKMGKVEQQQNTKYKCPVCNYSKVERQSKGIWECQKCEAKFASKAYQVAKLPNLKTAKVE